MSWQYHTLVAVSRVEKGWETLHCRDLMVVPYSAGGKIPLDRCVATICRNQDWMKTLYDQIWNICQICNIFEFYESGIFWRLLGGERCILEGWLWRSMLFKMTFLTTFISIIKLYSQIWQNFEYLMTSSKNTLKTSFRVPKFLGSGYF